MTRWNTAIPARRKGCSRWFTTNCGGWRRSDWRKSRQDLNEAEIAAPEIKHDLLALDKALDQLAKEDRPKYELVKLRFSAGLTIEQAAEALGMSTSTADRHRAYARAWLYRRIAECESHQGDWVFPHFLWGNPREKDALPIEAAPSKSHAQQ